MILKQASMLGWQAIREGFIRSSQSSTAQVFLNLCGRSLLVKPGWTTRHYNIATVWA